MSNRQISMDYFPEGDMLSITFGQVGRKGRGYELSDHIYIRVDLETDEPLGLTILSYSKLLALGEVPLSFWDELSPEEQKMMNTVLTQEPVQRFLRFKDMSVRAPVSTFQNPSLQQIVAM